MISRLKPVLFRVAAVLVPLLVLALVEMGLRFLGVAENDTQPFRRVEGHDDYLLLNGDYTGRYFGSFRPGVS
ncbi:MAG: hypothetical protein HKN13_11650, partial [Rhodothermales bacterium]|nr:hypothetical protein [Rhodothermales bacterium]